jgi:predicted dehydrogenase
MPRSFLHVGLGNQGREHLNAALALSGPRLKVVGVCDSDPTRAAIAEKLGLPYFQSYREALATLAPQVVVVCVPNHLHVEVTSECIRRGAHVLKEKPLALSMADGAHLMEQAAVHGKLLRVTQQRFYNPRYQAGHAWRSEIGRPTYVSYEFTLNDTRKSWYWDDRCGGGSWYGLGWHACAVVNWYLGSPKTVTMKALASGRRSWDYSTDDTAACTVEFENGCYGRILTSVAHPTKTETFQLHGTRGTIEVTRARAVLYDLEGRILRQHDAHAELQDAYVAQLSSFLDALDRGEHRDDHALPTMELVQAGLNSRAKGGSVIELRKALPSVSIIPATSMSETNV